MKNKLKFIIPIVITVIAIIVAALCINFTPAEKVDISSLVSTAQKYLIENNYEQAIAEFNKIIEIDPMNADAYIGIADAYIGMGDTEKAIEWLKKGYVLTGDERLKNMIDNYVAEVTTATSMTETEIITEESKPTELQISYADDWYSVFNYDNDGNILNMSLYNKDGEKRLSADYEYTDNGVERTVYVDNNLYETNTVIFRDVMADFEKQKKERANKKEEDKIYNYWRVYDENGDCIEHGWSHSDENYEGEGKVTFMNGVIFKQHEYNNYGEGNYTDFTTYYDEKGYELKLEVNADAYQDVFVYTYQYDDNGYPIIQYKNGEKTYEYTNYYKNNNFIYSICRYKNENNDNHYTSDNFIPDYCESNENGQYIRSLSHSRIDDSIHSNVVFYVPSYDETKIIDYIYIDCSNTKPLFECPYCYGEED